MRNYCYSNCLVAAICFAVVTKGKIRYTWKSARSWMPHWYCETPDGRHIDFRSRKPLKPHEKVWFEGYVRKW